MFKLTGSSARVQFFNHFTILWLRLTREIEDKAVLAKLLKQLQVVKVLLKTQHAVRLSGNR